jgi:EAL domain-containing protein (putative c-di-GMP-specific phosphodiesterase class I)
MEQLPSPDPLRLLRAPDATDVTAALVAQSRLEAKARLRFAVAQALVQGRMLFHFQPVVQARSPRQPAFFEMLARMRMPNGELLSAGAFLPAVEAGPLGRAIDRLALAQALRALKADPGLRLSVNMSPLSMGDEEWLDLFARAAREERALLGRLILEITEDAAVASADQTIDFMDHVRATGVAFALDDFGAGATGFRHFRDFRFDMVKIDGAFVRGVHAEPDAQVLVKALAGVARHFEMLTVAEFVETEAEAAWLRREGIDCLQGYLFGRASARPGLGAGVGAGSGGPARRAAG